jgi:predicted transcriptional regulator
MRKTNDKLILELLDKGMQQKEIAKLMNVSPAAICKRAKKLRSKPLPESLKKLTPKKQRFVLEKAEGKSNTAAAEIAFDTTSRESAKVIGSQLMADPDIQLALSDLLAQEGLSRRARVRRLRDLVFNADPNVSIRGLDQSWKLDGYKSSEEKEKPIIYISSEKLMILNQVEKLIKEYEEEQKKLKEEQQNQAAETQ